MSDKVVGIEVKSRVIICHSTSQIVDIVSREGTIDIISNDLRLQMYSLSEVGVGVFPLLS